MYPEAIPTSVGVHRGARLSAAWCLWPSMASHQGYRCLVTREHWCCASFECPCSAGSSLGLEEIR
ncbi:hypothetical protein DPMN_144646 [Dreissena polymorpha]|uniref:Uncharacterized protein n=1 Tax=Dreissena polymorpha TaxID=45954 RepID=A0A9D4IWS5_DREPO|nr:hypothetical protein DPMN_144646 [Dreissena polymorpha]